MTGTSKCQGSTRYILINTIITDGVQEVYETLGHVTQVSNYSWGCAHLNSLAVVKKAQIEPRMSYLCKAFAKETVLHHSVPLLNNISVKRRSNNGLLRPDFLSSACTDIHRHVSHFLQLSPLDHAACRLSVPRPAASYLSAVSGSFFLLSVRFRSTTVKWIREKREKWCVSPSHSSIII